MSKRKLKSMVVALAIACISVLSFEKANAQDINLNVYASYVFNDQFDSYYTTNQYYSGKLMGGLQWGIGLEYMPKQEYGIELLYIRQDTHAPTEYVGNGLSLSHTNFDITMQYFMLGGDRRVGTGKKVEGFFGLMLGAVIIDLYNPDNGRKASATKFAWGLRGGAIAWIKPKVGLKFQAQLISPTQAAGGGFYFGTGGAGAGLSSYSSLYQFSLGGGLVFKVRSH